MRKYLFSRGMRFRVQVRKLPGNPDIVLPKYKTVIFVNGCFWHGHEGCKYFRLPKSNVEFWKEKIERNIARDVRNETELKAFVACNPEYGSVKSKQLKGERSILNNCITVLSGRLIHTLSSLKLMNPPWLPNLNQSTFMAKTRIFNFDVSVFALAVDVWQEPHVQDRRSGCLRLRQNHATYFRRQN